MKVPMISHCLTVIATIVCTVFMAYLFMEWAMACGESFTDSEGVTHQNECMFKS